MPRVNIHLSDNLYKKLKKVKINVSAMCQEALEKELLKKEKLELRLDKMQELKEKLVKQKEESEQKDYSFGRDLAKQFAEKNSLDLDDFKKAETGKITDDTWEYIESYFENRIDDPENISKDVFIKGFTDAINEIKNELGF